MGSMTYAQMRKLYLQGTGDSPAAQEESYLHMTQGLRWVYSRVDLPESEMLDEEVIIKANTDRVLISDIDFDVFSIGSVSNSTDNTPMYPEPNGMDGRRLYLTSAGLPPTGNITHWVRDGRFLFVRNSPSVDTTLRVHGRGQSPEITPANLNESSPLPAQYDMPTVWAAVLNYVSIHEPPNGVKAEDWAAKKQGLMADRDSGMVMVSPRAEEDRTIRANYRLRGYSPTPTSRRRAR